MKKVTKPEPMPRRTCLVCHSTEVTLRGRVVSCRSCQSVYYLPARELMQVIRGGD